MNNESQKKQPQQPKFYPFTWPTKAERAAKREENFKATERTIKSFYEQTHKF